MLNKQTDKIINLAITIKNARIYTIIFFTLWPSCFIKLAATPYKPNKSYPSPNALNTLETSNPLGVLFAPALDILAHDSHIKFPATVQLSTSLCPEEKLYLKNRQPFIQKSLEEFLNIKLTDQNTPRIALCTSGGGLRAMFSTLGALSAFEQLNILNSISYIASLSGSAFALSSWIAHKCSVKDIKEILCQEFQQAFTADFEITEVLKTGITRLLYGQKLSPVNLFGALVANRIFSSFNREAYHIKLSDSVNTLASGKFPFPIYTAISIPQVELPEYTWFEFNPYEIRYQQDIFDVHVPSWAFGRSFSQGISQDQAPEYSLAFIMGICGSAFTVSLKELADMYKQSIPFFLQETIESLTSYTDIGTLRIQPGSVYNPLFEHPLAFNKYNTKYRLLELIDAGIDFNIPIPPLMDPARSINCIIIIDSSSSLQGAPELKRAEYYARMHNYPFPIIDYTEIENQLISVFQDSDPDTPTIIYIPLLKNMLYNAKFDPSYYLGFSRYLHTFNLYYTKEQAQELSGLLEFTIINQKNLIKDALLQCVYKQTKNNLKKQSIYQSNNS